MIAAGVIGWDVGTCAYPSDTPFMIQELFIT